MFGLWAVALVGVVAGLVALAVAWREGTLIDRQGGEE